MSYVSFEKFESTAGKIFSLLDSKKSNKNNFLACIKPIMGNQTLIAHYIGKISKIKLSPRDVFEIDLLFNSILSENYNLEMRLSSLCFKTEIIENLKENLKYLEETKQDVYKNTEMSIFVMTEKKIKEYQEKSLILNNCINKSTINNGDFNLSKYDETIINFKNKISKKELWKNNLQDCSSWKTLDESYFGTNEKNKLGFGMFYVEMNDLRDLYIKHHKNLKKLFNIPLFKGSFVSRNEGKIFLCIDDYLTITHNGQEEKIKDFEFLYGRDDEILKIKTNERNNYYSEDPDIFTRLDMNSIGSLLLLLKEENREQFIDKYLTENIDLSNHEFNNIFNELIAIYLFDIEENKKFKLYSVRNLFMYDHIINNNDFQKMALMCMKKITDKYPDFFLKLSEEKRNKILDIIQEMDDKFIDYKNDLITKTNLISKDKVQIVFDHLDYNMSLIHINDSAIFNYNLEIYKIESLINNLEKIKLPKIDCIQCATRNNRIIVSFYFADNFNYTNDIKDNIMNYFFEKIKNKLELDKTIVNDIENIIRETELKSKLETLDKVVVRKKM